jgi:hypothetical protein
MAGLGRSLKEGVCVAVGAAGGQMKKISKTTFCVVDKFQHNM